MNLETLRDLFNHELQDLYSAERQIVKALPKLIAAANAADLRRALELHLQETEIHVDRLKQVGKDLMADVDLDRCRAMVGLIDEGEDLVMRHTQDDDVRDAAIIGSCQRIEHYEIAAYGTARSYAQMLGELHAAALLGRTLTEEKAADIMLTMIADGHVNRAAMTPD